MARPVGLALSALVDVHTAATVSRDDLLPIFPADMCLRTTLAGNRNLAHLACPSVEVLQPLAAGHGSSLKPRRASLIEHAKTGATSTYWPPRVQPPAHRNPEAFFASSQPFGFLSPFRPGT
jgi:hypothetical protein